MGEDWRNATQSHTGHLKIPLITLPNTTCYTTLSMLKDTPVSVMQKIPFQSLKTDPPNSLTSNLRVIQFHGLIMHLNVREVLSDLLTKMDLPKPNAVSTLLELKKHLTEIYGWKVQARTLKQQMLHLRLGNPERLLLLLFMPHGVNSAKVWKMNTQNLLQKWKTPLMYSSSVVMK